MTIVYNKHIPFEGFGAMNVLGIWLFVRKVNKFGYWVAPMLSKETINHELIHSAQYKEMGYIGFLIWYGIEWLVRVVCEFGLWAVRAQSRVEFKDIPHAAYRNISLEQEAYTFATYEVYLSRVRTHYYWLRYLFKRTHTGQ